MVEERSTGGGEERGGAERKLEVVGEEGGCVLREAERRVCVGDAGLVGGMG